jgi:hypothetical protein
MLFPMSTSDRVGAPSDRQRDAENVLKKLGYARVSPHRRAPEPEPTFWVQEAGVPRRTFPVYVPPTGSEPVVAGIERWVQGSGRTAHRAIFVVPNDAAADEAWAHLGRVPGAAIDHEVSILVVPVETPTQEAPHFHLRVAEPREVLTLATGIVVGLFRRAQAADGTSQIDFEELLGLLQQRFGIDVHRSLHVHTDEEALFLLYQLAQRDAYAPGDPGANLHLLVLKPTGPSARLPWFAA